MPGGGRACTAHGADGGCWGGGRDRRPPALAELALQGGQRAASEAAGDGAQSAASAGRKAEAAWEGVGGAGREASGSGAREGCA